jgi:hypothetical protein
LLLALAKETLGMIRAMQSIAVSIRRISLCFPPGWLYGFTGLWLS